MPLIRLALEPVQSESYNQINLIAEVRKKNFFLNQILLFCFYFNLI